MLDFIAQYELRNSSPQVRKVGEEDADVNGARLEMLRDLVIERFIEQVKWGEITEMYLGGLVTPADLDILKRAVTNKGRGLVGS